MATKVIPAVSPVLIDPNKEVREKGFSTIQVFVQELEKHSSTIKDSTEQDNNTSSSSSWSWAQTLTSALYKGRGTEDKASELGTKPSGEKSPEAPQDQVGNVISGQSPPGGVTSNAETTSGEPESTQSEDEGVQGWGDDDQWESFEQGGWDVSKPVKSMSTGEFQDTGGWDDWKDDFDVPQSSSSVQSHTSSQKKDTVPLFTMKEDSSTKGGMSSSGWDEGWSDNWSDPFSKVSSSKPPSQSHEVDTRQQRQEERRKRQEAARQKRAAGHGSKPKLGSKGD
jgi:SCY1-like protein 1